MVFNSHILVDEIYFFNLLSQIFFGIKNPNTSAKNDPPAASQNPIKSHIVSGAKLYQPRSKYTNPEMPKAVAKSGIRNISKATTTTHASERKANIIHNIFGIPKSDITRAIKQNPATPNITIISIKKIVSAYS